MKPLKLSLAVWLAVMGPLGIAACQAGSVTANSSALTTASSARLQDNFYRAANQPWLQSTEIPANQTAVFGVDLPAITDQQLQQLLASLQQQQASAQGSAAAPALSALELQVLRYYQSYVDTQTIEQQGLSSLKPLVAEIAKWQSVADIAQWQGAQQGQIDTPIGVPFVMPGLDDPTTNQPMLSQGGLGLPGRAMYLDASAASLRTAYHGYLTKLATLAQPTLESTNLRALSPTQLADAALRVETAIAKAQWAPEISRDPSRMQSMTLAQLEQTAGDFPWQAFFSSSQLLHAKRFSNLQPGAIAALSQLYITLPLADWQAYSVLQTVHAAAPFLPKDFTDARFAFYGKTLSGMTQASSRERKALDELSAVLGEALGRLYSERYFPAAQQARVQQMAEQIKTTFRDSVATRSWLSLPTKQAALAKIDRMKLKIGYPTVWRDYGSLQLRADDALGNHLRAVRLNWVWTASRAGQPADPRAWDMLPQTVNAQYNPLRNDLEFPAALLQAPFFDMKADDASNYGALGAVIGHEISHGFDVMGSQFDAQGRLHNWWNDADRATFMQFAGALVEQFNAYQALPETKVNGELTLPENMADLVGLQMAFAAYQQSLRGKPAPVIGGLTGEQRFFVSYAQSRRSKVRPEQLKQWLNTDPHAPDEFRINGSLRHVDGFHQAFGTQPGDAMYQAPSERLRIW